MFAGIDQLLVAQQPKHRADWRVACAERHVRSLVALAVLDVQRHDAIVVLRRNATAS